MSIAKCNFETIQELFCLEYEKMYKKFPTKQEAFGSKHELILKIHRLKRKQRRFQNAISNYQTV